MLTEAKNQIKISILSIKYAVMKEMLNKATFISNILFMILNNASFIVQWIILFSIKDNIAGYDIKQVLLLWGLASGTYGISHFFFKKAYSLYDTINNGKLDAFLVQPKNVLLSAITTDVETSAIGDILYAYIILFIYGCSLPRFLLFTLFIITGGIMLTAITVILSSLSFWLNRSDIITETVISMITHFATYPDGIFKGITKIILYTIIPVGIMNYIPIHILKEFDAKLLLLVIAVTIGLTALAFLIFNKGLKRYSSSNLMSARI